MHRLLKVIGSNLSLHRADVFHADCHLDLCQLALFVMACAFPLDNRKHWQRHIFSSHQQNRPVDCHKLQNKGRVIPVLACNRVDAMHLDMPHNMVLCNDAAHTQCA